MTPRHSLGEFEQIVLLAVLRLGDEAVGPGISGELEARAGRTVSRGALYATLDRLERKGLLEWELGEATPETGGNRLRRFTVTREGVEELAQARQAWDRMAEGLESILTRRRS